MWTFWTKVPWIRYSHWDATRNGKSDGERGIPDQDQTLQPPYVMELKEMGEENIARLDNAWKSRDEKLLADYCATKHEIERMEAALEKAEQEVRASREEQKRAHEEYLKHFHVKPVWYFTFVSLIAGGEFVFNAFVLQLFGEDQFRTLIASLAISVAIPLCAHALGGQLKRGFLREGKFTAHTLWIILLGTLVPAMLWAISYLREKFFEAAGVQAKLHISLDPASITLVFLVMNLVLYLIATVLAYISHDPEAMTYLTSYRAATKVLKNSEAKVDLLEGRLEKARERQHTTAASREKLFGRTQDEAKEWRDIIQRMMSTYRRYNLRARQSQTMPKCFEMFPPIDVPNDIEPGNDKLARATLGWDCALLSVKEAKTSSSDGRVRPAFEPPITKSDGDGKGAAPAPADAKEGIA